MEHEMTTPRRSPSPCCDGCPGWAVFGVDRCTVHGDDCDCQADGCSSLEIQECDECWYDQPDAPGDDYYQEHPMCMIALEAAKVEAAIGGDDPNVYAAQRD